MYRPCFRNRAEAGQQLAAQLTPYAHRSDVVVLGLPRGGVVVAAEVAKVLQTPLEICLVRKLGVPGYEELAMGAIASGGIQVLNLDIIYSQGISQRSIDAALGRELQELQRREQIYRGDRPPLDIRDRTIILVDDGLATGSTMQAALMALKPQKPAQVIIAVPVSPPRVYQTLKQEVDACICLITPVEFGAIGLWYEDFTQTTDQEVCDRLTRPENVRSQV